MSAIIFSACNGNSSQSGSATLDSTSSKVMSSDSNKMSSSGTDSGMVMASDEAKDFSKGAFLDGMTEVALGKIAMKNSDMQSIKDFGEMMVNDHTKIDNGLKDLATKNMFDLPTAVTDDQQKDIDKLSKETGKTFDKDYVSMMYEVH